MIFTNLKIDNLFSFENITIDFTFKRAKQNSTIPNEHLSRYPKFRYKKVSILSGSNSSGKTSLGRVMCFVQNTLFSDSYNENRLSDKKNDKNKKALIITEFYHDNSLYEYHIIYDNNDIIFKIKSIFLYKKDTAYSARKRLNNAKLLDTSLKEIKKKFIKSIETGWLYIFTDDLDKSTIRSGEYSKPALLNSILKSFDSSIERIEPVYVETNSIIEGFKIVFANGDSLLIDKEGNASQRERLSTGTYKSLKIAYMIDRIMGDEDNADEQEYSNFYFLDEVMAYVQCELEKSIINLIIEKLPKNSQFIYTTHNYDILDLDLPIHSFIFLKKITGKTSAINAESIFKKNDRSIINYVKNNYFNCLPNTDLIDGML